MYWDEVSKFLRKKVTPLSQLEEEDELPQTQLQENALMALRRMRHECDDGLRRARQERHWTVQEEREQCEDALLRVCANQTSSKPIGLAKAKAGLGLSQALAALCLSICCGSWMTENLRERGGWGLVTSWGGRC
jgi:hypothetical protein